MISIKDVYECNELINHIAYKQKAILRNVREIESGNDPAFEVLRQTGRTTLMCANAIMLMSSEQVVVIYAHSLRMGRIIKDKIKNMSNEVDKKTGHHIPYNEKLIVTTHTHKHSDLAERRWDIELTDAEVLDIKMHKTGFYV
jgi:hypothetical protein